MTADRRLPPLCVRVEVDTSDLDRAHLTLGDALDILLGGPSHFISDHCGRATVEPDAERLHSVCAGYYGGRTCECRCHRKVGGQK